MFCLSVGKLQLQSSAQTDVDGSSRLRNLKFSPDWGNRIMLLSTSGRELNCWKFWIISVALFGISSMPDSEAVSVLSESEMVMSESNWSKIRFWPYQSPAAVWTNEWINFRDGRQWGERFFTRYWNYWNLMLSISFSITVDIISNCLHLVIGRSPLHIIHWVDHQLGKLYNRLQLFAVHNSENRFNNNH